MRVKVEIAERTVAEVAQEAHASLHKISAFAKNPFLKSQQSVGKIVGLCEGREVGGEYVFPVRIKTGTRIYEALAGSTLSVLPEFRKSGLGMDLPELRWQKSECGIALGAGLSQMALPVHQLLDYNVFLLPRLLVLWKSRSVVEMKLKGFALRVVSKLVDVAICGYALMLKLIDSLKMMRFQTSVMSPKDAESLADVARLIADDVHAYCEVHDEAWLKWHLTESFSANGPAQLTVVRRQGVVVGFWMTKKRFHEQASHRGFKNVWLGSIVEWQVAPGYEKMLPWFLLAAALTLRGQGVDAVELPTDDADLQGFFRRLGWRTVGEGNFVIKAGETSPLARDEEMRKQDNWRMRPAMGDNGLS